MCSSCFRAKMSAAQLSVQDHVAKPEVGRCAHQAAQDSAPQALAAAAPAAPAQPSDSAAEPAAQSADTAAGAPGEGPKKKNRCFVCKKKVGLLGFECKCGRLLCSNHRTAEEHECDYDYRTEGKKRLADANPVIAFSKIDAL